MTGFLSCPYSLVVPITAILPNFVAAGTAGAGTTTVVGLGLPAGLIADDIMLLICETANQNIDAVAGWTHVTGSPAGHGVAGGVSATQLSVLWKRHSGSESVPTVTGTGTDHIVAGIVGFRGCKTVGDPWNAIAFDGTGGLGTTATTPTVTTTVNNCLVVLFSTSSFDTTSSTFFSGYTNGALANITEILDGMAATGNGGGAGVATGEKTVAGIVGTSAITLANSSEWATATIALASV